jgi:hypothetical protein
MLLGILNLELLHGTQRMTGSGSTLEVQCGHNTIFQTACSVDFTSCRMQRSKPNQSYEHPRSQADKRTVGDPGPWKQISLNPLTDRQSTSRQTPGQQTQGSRLPEPCKLLTLSYTAYCMKKLTANKFSTNNLSHGLSHGRYPASELDDRTTKFDLATDPIRLTYISNECDRFPANLVARMLYWIPT